MRAHRRSDPMKTSPPATTNAKHLPPNAPRPPDHATLAALLEATYVRWHRIEEVERDPLRFPRRFRLRQDREAAGFIASAFAFGRVAAFLPVLETLFERLGPSPAATIANLSQDQALALAAGLGYRFARPHHVAGLLRGIGAMSRIDGGPESFIERSLGEGLSVTAGLSDLARAVRTGAGDLDPGFLVPLEGRAGPLKRLHLFLRWMVRNDGIDLGEWAKIPASTLVMPMDVHVGRISRLLGLIPPRRSNPNLADAVALTRALAVFDPLDPVRFDFALSHVGISGHCTGLNSAACERCPLSPVCTVHAQH